MKCSRPSCSRVANRKSLCHQHYALHPVRGFVPAGPVRERIALLRERGIGLRRLSELTGVTEPTLLCQYESVQARTAQKVFAVPIPDRVVGECGWVSSVGTVRRINALVAVGYTQRRLAELLGVTDRRVSCWRRQDLVTAESAAKVDRLFRELQLTRGPSERSVAWAQRNGWPLPLQWDEEDLDDPDAQPCKLTYRKGGFVERYRELRDHKDITHTDRIAQELGITAQSLRRQVTRHRTELAS